MAKPVPILKLKYIALYIPTAILLFLVVILVLVPILIYRFFINILAHWLEPHLGPMLSGMDAGVCGPQPYDNPIVTLLAVIPLQQTVSREQFIRVMDTQLITKNYYPNLKQRIVKKFGYVFWKNVKNFSLEHHVLHFNPSNSEQPVTSKQFQVWYSENSNKGFTFDSSRSPWEFLLIKNYVDLEDSSVKSLAVLKVNHCLMDGYSVLSFLQKLALKPWKLNAQPSNQTKKLGSILSKMLRFLWLTISLPNYIMRMTNIKKDKNTRFCKALASSKDLDNIIMENPLGVSMSRLKDIKNHYHVSLASLLMTLASSAAANQFKTKFGEILETMKFAFVLPWPKHEDALTNHATASCIMVQVFENDPVKTLLELDKKYQEAIRSNDWYIRYFVVKAVGVLPVWLMLKLGMDLPTSSLYLTNIPGPASQKTDLCGFEYSRLHAKVSTPFRTFGFLFVSYSMGSSFYVDVEGLYALLQGNEAREKFTKSFYETLAFLEKNAQLC